MVLVKKVILKDLSNKPKLSKKKMRNSLSMQNS